MNRIGRGVVAVTERIKVEADPGRCIDEQQTPMAASRCVSGTGRAVSIADREHQKAFFGCWHHRRWVSCAGLSERNQHLYNGGREHLDTGSRGITVELATKRIEPCSVKSQDVISEPLVVFQGLSTQNGTRDGGSEDAPYRRGYGRRRQLTSRSDLWRQASRVETTRGSWSWVMLESGRLRLAINVYLGWCMRGW